MPVPSRLTSLKPELLLNRNGHYTVFSMPVPSGLTYLKPELLLNRIDHYVAFSIPVQPFDLSYTRTSLGTIPGTR